MSVVSSTTTMASSGANKGGNTAPSSPTASPQANMKELRPSLGEANRYSIEYHRFEDMPVLECDRETHDREIKMCRPGPPRSKDSLYKNNESSPLEAPAHRPTYARKHEREQVILANNLQVVTSHKGPRTFYSGTGRGPVLFMPDSPKTAPKTQEGVDRELDALQAKARIGVEKELLLDAYYKRNRSIDGPHPGRVDVVTGRPLEGVRSGVRESEVMELVAKDPEREDPVQLSRDINKMRSEILSYKNYDSRTMQGAEPSPSQTASPASLHRYSQSPVASPTAAGATTAALQSGSSPRSEQDMIKRLYSPNSFRII